MDEIGIIKFVKLADTDFQISAFEEMFGALEGELSAETLAEIKSAVLLREETSSTYIQDALAVPHSRVKTLDKFALVVGVNERGIDWPTEDAKAHLVILINAPEKMITGYLHLLQKLLKWHKASKLVGPNGEIKATDIDNLREEINAALK